MALNVGSITPASVYVGAVAVSKMYLGSLEVYSSSGSSPFTTFSANWGYGGFSGTGFASTPYSAASAIPSNGNFDGAYFTVIDAGTVRITAQAAHSDNDFTVTRTRGATVTSFGYSGSGSGYDGAVDLTITVQAGDKITLGAAGDYLAFNYTTPFTHYLKIWWTA